MTGLFFSFCILLLLIGSNEYSAVAHAAVTCVWSALQRSSKCKHGTSVKVHTVGSGSASTTVPLLAPAHSQPPLQAQLGPRGELNLLSSRAKYNRSILFERRKWCAIIDTTVRESRNVKASTFLVRVRNAYGSKPQGARAVGRCGRATAVGSSRACIHQRPGLFRRSRRALSSTTWPLSPLEACSPVGGDRARNHVLGTPVAPPTCAQHVQLPPIDLRHNIKVVWFGVSEAGESSTCEARLSRVLMQWSEQPSGLRVVTLACTHVPPKTADFGNIRIPRNRPYIADSGLAA